MSNASTLVHYIRKSFQAAARNAMTTGSHSEPCINWPCAKGAGHAGPCGTSRDDLTSKTVLTAIDAEPELPGDLPSEMWQQCAQEQDGEYSREDDPNFNEAMTGDLLAQAEYWDAVARQGGRSDE